MDSKAPLKLQILDGSIARRVFFRALFFASAVSIVTLIRVLSKVDLGALAPMKYIDCVADSSSSSSTNVSLTPGSYLFQSRVMNSFWGSFDSMNCKKDVNLTASVVTELMGKQFLNCGARSLCIGDGSSMAVSAMQQLGFSSVTGVHKHRFFSIKQKAMVYELYYQDCSFDFVFTKDMDKVSVPALLVLEVERILKPGGIGAFLMAPSGSNPKDLIGSATPFASLLRSSNVVHVGNIEELNLVVFKKRSENTTYFYQNRLPADCPSLTFTKPLIELMEPLVEERPPEYEKRISYLPKFVDISTRKRLLYIDIGVGELLNANVNDWFLPSYPVDQKSFNACLIHYNTSVLLPYVKRPGMTFVYHPGLAGKVKANHDADADGDRDPSFVGEEEFDFLAWFKETVQHADFMVLKMNVGKVELKFLSDIFESAAICYVDELFLGCPESDGSGKITRGSCMETYKGLRSNGVYVHQWWADQIASN